MTKWNIGIVMLAIVLIIVGGYVFVPYLATAPTDGALDSGNATAKIDLIRATTPAAGSTITSPLIITGTARGTWYFEASFPYQLLDEKGVVIARGPVQAQGDWMTENFVPFSTTITFPPQKKGSHGTLLLKKDNPSDLPEKEDQLIIPVEF